MSKIPAVHISDKRRSTFYQRESNDEDDEVFHIHTHFSEEFIRFQEFSNDSWGSRHHYMLFCLTIANNNDIFPLLMRLAFQLSGGTFLLLLIVCTLVMGLPLVYMEAFLGRYTRLSNCQLYRMAPILFGTCFLIFFMNVGYNSEHVVQDTQILVNLLKLLVNPDMSLKCLDEDVECYDYKIKGPLVNDTCRYKHFSMMCENHGEIKYPMEYLYWKMYKDPKSTLFPYYQIITGVVITWGVILSIIMKGIQALASIVYVGFIMQITVLTVIFALALGQDGSFDGLELMVSVNIDGLDIYKVITVLCLSIWRLRLIIPTGYMTYSAYARFESNLGAECFGIVAFGLVLAIYYLLGFCVLCGVLSRAMGVNPEAVFVHDVGLYLAMVPELLAHMQMPTIFAIVYYAFMWFFETVKIALCVHMLALNLFDYFPTTKNFAAYIWVTSCIVLCFLSFPLCGQYNGTTFAPFLVVVYIQFVILVLVTIETTVVSFVYGIDRLCNDIHFMTGRKPLTYFRVMWYVIPFIGLTCSVLNFRQYVSSGIEDVSFMKGMTARDWLYVDITYLGLLSLGILASIMYVIFRFGTPNLLLVLIKPQYFWGPPEMLARIERKKFSPDTLIRSQVTYSRGNDIEYSDTVNNKLIMQFSRSILQEHTARGGAQKDRKFLPSIGIFSEISNLDREDQSARELQRDVDITDAK